MAGRCGAVAWGPGGREARRLREAGETAVGPELHLQPVQPVLNVLWNLGWLLAVTSESARPTVCSMAHPSGDGVPGAARASSPGL